LLFSQPQPSPSLSAAAEEQTGIACTGDVTSKAGSVKNTLTRKAVDRKFVVNTALNTEKETETEAMHALSNA